jgi:hypothetical protein
MINLLRKWLQKLKHKPQLSGERKEEYPDQGSTPKQKPQNSNPQRITKRSTSAKEDKLSYEEVFGQATDQYLVALAAMGKLQSFCFLINLEVELHNQAVAVNVKKS